MHISMTAEATKGRPMNYPMNYAGMAEARQVLTDIVDDARDRDTPTALTEHRRPRAVVVSVRFYERAKSDAEVARLLWERHPQLFDELKREVPDTSVPRKITAPA
jgi:prevent-host-death family protein